MEYSREQLIERLQTNLDAWHTENAVVLMPIEPKPDKPCLRDIVAELRRTESSECRVMTLEEVLELKEDTPIYIEQSDGLHGWDVFRGIDHLGDIITGPQWATSEYWEQHDYNDKWRVWTSRPTDAQREATPWQTR